MLAIKCQGSRQSVAQRNLRLPTELRRNQTMIAAITTDIDRFAFAGKFDLLDFAAAVNLHEQFGQLSETDGFGRAEIENLSICSRVPCGQKQCLNHVIDKIELANLRAIAKNTDRLTFDQLLESDSKKGLAFVFHAHARTVSVR
jgi:hypothetical protein